MQKLQNLRVSDSGDDFPGFVQDGEPLRLWRIGAGQTATQRAVQQVLQRQNETVCFKIKNEAIFKHFLKFLAALRCSK